MSDNITAETLRKKREGLTSGNQPEFDTLVDNLLTDYESDLLLKNSATVLIGDFFEFGSKHAKFTPHALLVKAVKSILVNRGFTVEEVKVQKTDRDDEKYTADAIRISI